MPKNSEKNVLSIARCKRLVRPLLSKVHSLTDLQSKYPDKFFFDTELFASHSKNTHELIKPATAQDRLILLKPFLSQEIYEAYVEIFNMFKNIIFTLFPETATQDRNGKTAKSGKRRKIQNGESISKNTRDKFPRLSFLAAQKLGKSVALGTKSTHYSLNQTALFDPNSIPVYLRKYHDQLAEDIDEWLLMEPSSVLGLHRQELLLGYVLHIFVFNLRMLFYTFIPVLCHWLHEQNMASLRSLFIEYWLFLHLDPDHEEVQELTAPDKSQDPSLDIFWVFHRGGYWQQLVLLLRVKMLEYSSNDQYEALFLDALVSSDRLDLKQVDVHEIYALMRNNLQHPKNTLILVAIIALLITSSRELYKTATTSIAAHEAIVKAQQELRNFLQAWLSLSKSCIFNTLDRGNPEIFDACFMWMAYLDKKCALVLEYLESAVQSKISESIQRFKTAKSDIAKLNDICIVLQAFFLDTALSLSIDSHSTVSTVKYFMEFVREDCDDETIDIFIGWLEEQDPENNKLMSLLHSQMTSFQQ